MVLALVLFVCLGLSMLFNLAHFISAAIAGGTAAPHGGRIAGPRLDEVMLEDKGSVNKVAVVEVNGIITSDPFDGGSVSIVELIKAQLKHAENDDRVKAVILKVDSPGGEVLASDMIYHSIAEFQRKSGKPVVASMGSVAASGGYYVSAPCRWIVANELTLTGSIGVIMSAWNYRGLMDKVGVRPVTYKSGKHKDMLSGSRSLDQTTDEERTMLQNLINETFTRFKRVVEEGRQRALDSSKEQDSSNKVRSLDEKWEDYADGRVLSGTEAFRLGFVDQLGDFTDAAERARKLVGIRDANLVEYRQRYELSDLFRLFGKSDAKSIKVDVGMELPRLKAGQLYLLSPTYIQ